jgi:hypothetical protein
MIKELYELYRWGDLHELYTMTIPKSYIGHKDFLDKGIVKEFYAVNTKEAAEKWVQEDILDYYKSPCMCKYCNPEQNHFKQDFRVHIVRVNNKNVSVVQDACIRKGVSFRNHTSIDRLSEDEIKEFSKEPLTQHIVLGVKGLWRRANLIPNILKLRIGATLELYTKTVDNNVQIQGLVGRMTGYWRDYIDTGHKTGPYRTSIKAIEEYEKTYEDPFGLNSYNSCGFKKKEGIVSAVPTMLSAKNIQNLEAIELPVVHKKGSNPIVIIDITEEEIGYFKNTSKTLEVIRKYNEDVYNKYATYEEVCCWRMDTPIKCEKWRLNAMLQSNAYSSETNIKDKTKNNLMIYLYENKLIISAWSGQPSDGVEKPKRKIIRKVKSVE